MLYLLLSLHICYVLYVWRLSIDLILNCMGVNDPLNIFIVSVSLISMKHTILRISMLCSYLLDILISDRGFTATQKITRNFSNHETIINLSTVTVIFFSVFASRFTSKFIRKSNDLHGDYNVIQNIAHNILYYKYSNNALVRKRKIIIVIHF